ESDGRLVSADLDVRLGEVAVPAIAAGADACCGELQRTRQRRERIGVEHHAYAAPRCKLVAGTQQAEAGHVPAGLRLQRPPPPGRAHVQLEHRLDRSMERAGRSDAVALSLQDDAGPEALGEQEHVAGLRSGFWPDALGMDGPDDRETVLWLAVANR